MGFGWILPIFRLNSWFLSNLFNLTKVQKSNPELRPCIKIQQVHMRADRSNSRLPEAAVGESQSASAIPPPARAEARHG